VIATVTGVQDIEGFILLHEWLANMLLQVW